MVYVKPTVQFYAKTAAAVHGATSKPGGNADGTSQSTTNAYEVDE
jgi:hypothetical protein